MLFSPCHVALRLSCCFPLSCSFAFVMLFCLFLAALPWSCHFDSIFVLSIVSLLYSTLLVCPVTFITGIILPCHIVMLPYPCHDLSANIHCGAINMSSNARCGCPQQALDDTWLDAASIQLSKKLSFSFKSTVLIICQLFF